MNTLFTRTLLWFIATVVLTFVATALATTIDFERDRQRPPFGTMLSLQLSEARNAYETGGREALAQALQRFREVTRTDSILTDAQGRDLVTGELRSDLIEESQRRRNTLFPRWYGSVAVRESTDGQYQLFMTLRRRSLTAWLLQPEVHVTILTVLAALSYLFARYLTKPVRQLQSAVECFGRGEFHSRVQLERKDELGQLARTFNRMADRIETLLNAERRLLLDISHELRSPLARLNVAVELARSGTDVSRHLDRIEKEAERLNGLVGELLQVTRAEGDESRMRHEPVALGELLRNVVEDARLEAEQRGCRVEWGERRDITISADPELIRRCVENVVRNAVRFTDPGTAVVVSLAQRTGQARIEVRDHGPGVPPESLGRIFDPFYRVDTHRDRSSGGAGLGLAIARRAVELHHGTIAASNANPGLRVEIVLPV